MFDYLPNWHTPVMILYPEIAASASLPRNDSGEPGAHRNDGLGNHYSNIVKLFQAGTSLSEIKKQTNRSLDYICLVINNHLKQNPKQFSAGFCSPDPNSVKCAGCPINKASPV
jgi:hypothetical protein